MGLELIVAAVAFAVTAASTAYQIVQAKKMRKAAQEAADARKGFEIPTEGQPEFLPKIYGRAMVGGVRPWHATANEFRHVTTNADKSFLTGTPSFGSYNYGYTVWGQDVYSRTAASRTVGSTSSGFMDSSLPGGKNDFLFYQQALCLGPIKGVRDAIVDGRYLDDPSLGSYGNIEKTTTQKKHSGVKAALRLDYHYYGGEADAITSANFSSRSTATFDKMVFLSACFRIDRDSPQFQGVPGVQSLIEGALVRTVSNGVISNPQPYSRNNTSGWAYSNNPAWCLLHYLLDRDVGKSCDLDEIDLASFEAAAAVCARIVQTGVAVGGKFWIPTGSTQTNATRNVPLYECNVMLDTSKPVRENIEAILATMGDARLVWSGGKYRLSLQYVNANSELQLAGVVTDDQLVMGEDIEVSWPTAQDRYNFVTVRFHNEYEGFKEDSVSWPPKYNSSYMRGVGGYNAPIGVGSWDDGKAGGRLLNSYNVWDSSGNSTNYSWLLKVEPDERGNYTISIAGDDNVNFTIKDNVSGAVLQSFSNNNWKNVVTRSVTLGSASQTKLYRIEMSGTNQGTGDEDYKGIAAKIDNGNRVLWTTRSTSYNNYVQVNETDLVYNLMKQQDNGLELETELFADGITDPHHALAKAEELCRTSRSATSYKFKYVIVDRYYEPGDFVQLVSPTMGIGTSVPLYLRVDAVKVSGDDRCEISGTRFDYSQLAWAVKDDVFVSAPNVYSFVIPQVYEVRYLPPNGTNIGGSGRLECDPVSSFPEFAGYVFYMHRAGIDQTDEVGTPIYTELARTPVPYYDLPPVDASSAFFGVRVLSSNGRMSAMTTTDPRQAVDMTHAWARRLDLQSSGFVFTEDDGTVVPASYLLTAAAKGFTSPVYKWYVDGQEIGNTSSTYVLNSFLDTTSKNVKVVVHEDGDPTLYTSDKDFLYIKVPDQDVDFGPILDELEANQLAVLQNVLSIETMNQVLEARTLVEGQSVGTKLLQERQQRTDGQNAIVSDLNLLGAKNSSGTGWVLNAAGVRLDDGSGNSFSLQEIGQKVGSQEGSISELREVLVTGDGTTAKAVLRVDVNGHILGTVLTNDGTTGSYSIVADAFQIINPNNGNPFSPFSIVGNTVKMLNVEVDTIKANVIDANMIRGAAVTGLSSYSFADVMIPDNRAVVNVVQLMSLDIGDARDGKAIAYISFLHDSTMSTDYGARIFVEVNTGNGWVLIRNMLTGLRTNGGDTRGSIPYSFPVPLMGSVVDLRVTAQSDKMPSASDYKTTYFRNIQVDIFNARR